MTIFLKNLKNYCRIHCITIISSFLLLQSYSNANALMIQIENLTNIPQTGISLGFDEPPIETAPLLNISDSDIIINIIYGSTLLSGDEPYVEDIPSIVPGMAVDYYSFLGSPNFMNGPVTENNIIDISSGTYSIEVGSNNPNYDRVRLTFFPFAVIPEPASLFLLGSGLMGLLVLRRR